jgi:chromosomal replication initiator protein
MKAIWEEVKTQIQSGFPPNTYLLWIKPMTFLGVEDQKIVLGCPNKFSRNWVEENYLEIIRDSFHKMTKTPVDLVLKVGPKTALPAADKNLTGHRQLALPNMPANKGNGLRRLNSDFTFNRFVVGSSNEFAYSASRALGQCGNLSYNTLLMLANTGLGKSHLAQAIGNAVLDLNPQSRVLYVTAEDFANDMVASLKSNTIDKFKDKYRKCCDVLLLEEVHFLSGKEKTQSELGYTLDALVNDNKKIIFTSSLPPKDIPKISRELTSRFTSGLVTTIDGPDYETRIKILTKKASENDMALSEEIVHFLAGCLTKDVRQMESALKCLKAKSDLLKARIDLDLAKEVVSCLISSERATSTEHIKMVVSKYYKIDPDILKSKSRKKVHAYPRNIYVYLCRRHTHEPLEKIAHTVNRSHSTVVYATEIVERKLKSDDKMRYEVDFLNKKIDDMRK